MSESKKEDEYFERIGYSIINGNETEEEIKEYYFGDRNVNNENKQKILIQKEKENNNDKNNVNDIDDDDDDDELDRKMAWIFLDRCPKCGGENIEKVVEFFQEERKNEKGEIKLKVKKNYYIYCQNLPKSITKILNDTPQSSFKLTRKKVNPTALRIEARLCKIIRENYINKNKCGFASWIPLEKCPSCLGTKFETVEYSKKIIYVCCNSLSKIKRKRKKKYSEYEDNNNILQTENSGLSISNSIYEITRDQYREEIENCELCGTIVKF